MLQKWQKNYRYFLLLTKDSQKKPKLLNTKMKNYSVIQSENNQKRHSSLVDIIRSLFFNK